MGAAGCPTIVMVSLDEYEEIRNDPDSFLTAPGHEIDGAKLVEQRSGYEVRRGTPPREENGGHRRYA